MTRVATLLAALLLALTACSSADGAASVSSAVDSGATIIDVRTPAEFAEGHVAGATNIDVSAPDFEQRLAGLDPEASYVVYCRSGSRSADAAARMRDAGFTDVVDGGGLGDMDDAGYSPTATD